MRTARAPLPSGFGFDSTAQEVLGARSLKGVVAIDSSRVVQFRITELPMAETQISAYISKATKEKVERHAAAHGVQRGHLVEEALLHHLQALRELPADIVVPPRLVLTQRSFEKLSAVVKKPREPTALLLKLMAGKRVNMRPLKVRAPARCADRRPRSSRFG